MKEQTKRAVNRFFLLQLTMTGLCGAVFYMTIGGHAAISSLFAGLTVSLPSYYFAQKLFTYRGAKQARKIVNAFYQGEALKIILTIIMLALVFSLMKIKPLPFFITFIVVQFSFWLAPLLFKKA